MKSCWIYHEIRNEIQWILHENRRISITKDPLARNSNVYVTGFRTSLHYFKHYMRSHHIKYFNYNTTTHLVFYKETLAYIGAKRFSIWERFVQR